MKEREVNLLDLCVEILLHWRGMLAAMLLGSVLLGGISAARQMLAWKAQAPLQPWEALDDAQRTRVQEAVALQRQYEQSLEYQRQSALMQWNPWRVRRVDLSFAVQADSYQKAYALARAYGYLTESMALYRYVEEQCHLDSGAGELISLQGEFGNGAYAARGSQTTNVIWNMPASGGSADVGEAQAVLAVGNVQILHDDTYLCNAMADAVTAFLGEQQRNLAQAFGSHELVLLNRSQGEAADQGIMGRISQMTAAKAELQSRHAAILQSFSDEEMAYYHYLTEGVLENGVQPDSGGGAAVGGQIGANAKYVLLGAALSVLLYAFAVFLQYTMDGRIRGTDSLQELYGIPHLGTVPAAPPKKRPLGRVDEWVLKLRCWNRRKFTQEEATRLAAAAAKMAAVKAGKGTVCCLGCCLQGSALAVCGEVKGQLEAAGIRVEILDNVLYDAGEMARVEGAGSAVLVETAGVTLYDEVCRELELLQRQGIAVLGGIVAE